MPQKYDMSQFTAYAHKMAKPGRIAQQHGPANEQVLLRFWNTEKSKYLYTLLGEELILSRPIKLEETEKETFYKFSAFYRAHSSFIDSFLTRLRRTIHPIWGDWGNHLNEDSKLIDGAEYVLGSISGDDWSFPYDVNTVIRDEVIHLTAGQKAMRALGKIAHALKMDEEFEQFRVAHSQVLNQRFLTGELCLSIHPLDYATASDNANGWTSCMSWQEEGCYRLGTVEMMNSPMVICAYLKGKNTIEVGGAEWNSKKWRAWIIIDENFVVMNKSYPYKNDALGTLAVEWVIELAKKNLGWEYSELNYDLRPSKLEFLYTNYMYNDLDRENNICAFGPNFDAESVCFSGPANCMWCGKEIEPHTCEPGTLACKDCLISGKCHICGSDVYLSYREHEGHIYCNWCFDDFFMRCSRCGDLHPRNDINTVAFFVQDTATFGALMEKHLKQHPRKGYFFHHSSPVVDFATGELTRQVQSRCIERRFYARLCPTCASFYNIKNNLIYLGPAALKEGYTDTEHYYLDISKVPFDTFMQVIRPLRRFDAEEDEVAVEFWKEYYEIAKKEFEEFLEQNHYKREC